MRIRELFESNFFKSDDYVTHKESGEREINFDLAEDLMHFMNHDDSVYRRHLYPSIARCIDITSRKNKPSPNIFKSAVKEGYKKYLSEFPIGELPDDLDEETCTEICKRICEEICNDIKEGKYKD